MIHGIEMWIHLFENHGVCVVDMVIGMIWLHIKDDSSSDDYYSEIIWMMEDIVDKHSVTF